MFVSGIVVPVQAKASCRMAYIEENMKKRRLGEELGDSATGTSHNAVEASSQPDAQRKSVEEGNVTNSASMLTAIPEVDLGMEYVYGANLARISLTVLQRTSEEH